MAEFYEELWIKYMLALASNSGLAENDPFLDAKLADEFIDESKKRFR